MGLVRNPYFWRRFSLAVHLDEEAKGSIQKSETSIFSYAPDTLQPSNGLAGPNPLKGSLLTCVHSDEWLKKQQKKRRRSILCGFLILASVAIVVGGVVVVLWWFSEHNWLQGRE